MSDPQGWVTISEDDHHTTLAMAAGYGALVKNLSFEQRKIDGMNLTVQVSESMTHVPHVVLEERRGKWMLIQHRVPQ